MKKNIFYIAITLLLTITIVSVFNLNHTKAKYNTIVAEMHATIEHQAADLIKYKNFTYDTVIAYEDELSKITPADYKVAATPASPAERIKFCVVVPSYNNIAYALQNLNSVFRQNYHNWRMIYIDDASTDGMSEVVHKIKQNSNLPDEKFTLKKNKERTRSALYNIYYGAHNFCHDDEVLVMLDGDDMLSTSNVLKRLADTYNDNKIWLTYGNQINIANNSVFDNNQEISSQDWPNLRSINFTTSHLHTVYTWLFKKIKMEDLQYEGKFFSSAWDLSIMYPILEMAGKDRTKSIDDLLYIYRSHPNNDGRLYSSEQLIFDKYIRSLPSYKRLDDAQQ